MTQITKMNQDEVVRKHLLESLDGRNAHAGLEDTVKDFPEQYYNKKIDGVQYSCWELLEHIRIGQDDIIEFILNPNYKEKPWPEGYWPQREANEHMWKDSIENIIEGKKELKAMLEDDSIDLFAPIPHAPDYTIFREIVLIIDHNSYHTGQLLMLRRALGIWSES